MVLFYKHGHEGDLKHSSFATAEHCFVCLTVIINNYLTSLSLRFVSPKSCWNPLFERLHERGGLCDVESLIGLTH